MNCIKTTEYWRKNNVHRETGKNNITCLPDSDFLYGYEQAKRIGLEVV